MIFEFAPDAPIDQIAQRLLDSPLEALLGEAEALTVAAHGPVVAYSRNVFIPLTHLCADVCHYCTFAEAPRRMTAPFMSLDAVREIAGRAVAAGCREALFTLGDRPERRYRAAADWLAAHGHQTTLDYLESAAAAVRDEFGLMPHLNPGLLDAAAFAKLRPVAVSMGLMLETASDRLSRSGGPHHGSPDKLPARRIDAIAAAGEARTAFTSGILVGIGETRRERLEALVVLRDLHVRYGHLQEIIVQNFRAKPGTRMAAHPDLSLAEHLWTIAAARLILGGKMSIQAPPNLNPDALPALLRAGVNDWGGISPVTRDHVNPEAPWPHLEQLDAATTRAGRLLRERLAIGPAYASDPEKWLDPGFRSAVRRAVDGQGYVFQDAWRAGAGGPVPVRPRILAPAPVTHGLTRIFAKAERGARLDRSEITRLFCADGSDARAVIAASDAIRRARIGDAVTYVINRNINYTNICLHRCGFCAFSKGGTRDLRGPAYAIDADAVGQRAFEAWRRGATEVCLQGGIHPHYDGHTYLSIIRAVKRAAPDIHIHAFSPLEISHGARRQGLSIAAYLTMLHAAGLGSLPGTAAEILDDRVRARICPGKLDTNGWVTVMRAAHAIGLRSTATIMFGHVDTYGHWAAHLSIIRDLQVETGGFTEFVPLPFVHMEAPMWRRGLARSGPSFREALSMHAVARLALVGVIDNIQTSWVKMGAAGAAAALRAGANDLGGVLMDESITRAAGGANGQMMDSAAMGVIAARVGRPLVQRTTLYGTTSSHQRFATDDRLTQRA